MRRKKIIKVFSRKNFINKSFNHSDASIFSQVMLDMYEPNTIPYTYADLKIRDCNKVVSLSIDFNTAQEFSNSIYKVDSIINNLREFRKGLVKGRDIFLREVEKAREYEKKKKIKKKR